MLTDERRAFWRDRSVFVSGGTGLVGGWLTKALIGLDAGVVLLVRDESPQSLLAHENLMPRLTVVRGDIGDYGLLKRAMAEYSVDTVFHLAAQPIVGVAKLDPLGTFETNIRGTWQLLEAARQAKARQVVVASSDKAYGSQDHLPYDETQALRGEFPYDVSKSCTDLIARAYARTYGLPVSIARCANLFGGGDFNFSRFLPGLIRATLRGERFVIRSDGQFVRDYMYVKDAVSAYLTLAEALTRAPELAGEAFNFSLGLRLTVLEAVRTVLRLMGRPDLEPVILNQATGEIREQYLSSAKSLRVLGWNPQYDFEAGLRETIDWYAAVFPRRFEAKAASAD